MKTLIYILFLVATLIYPSLVKAETWSCVIMWAGKPNQEIIKIDGKYFMPKWSGLGYKERSKGSVLINNKNSFLGIIYQESSSGFANSEYFIINKLEGGYQRITTSTLTLSSKILEGTCTRVN